MGYLFFIDIIIPSVLSLVDTSVSTTIIVNREVAQTSILLLSVKGYWVIPTVYIYRYSQASSFKPREGNGNLVEIVYKERVLVWVSLTIGFRSLS